MLACKDHHLGVLSYLLEREVDLDKRNLDGETALSLACKRRFIDGVRILLQSGAKRDTLVKGYSLSTLAWMSGDVDLVSLIEG
jgi:ankyrin repeat protein